MNAKQVLNKIIATLSLSKEDIALTYAKLADGTILESPTFDVGEAVDVVSEDGTKSPAPAGEHEVILKDSEGNDVRIKIYVDAEGKISERENVELPESEDMKAEEKKVKKLPEDMESIAGEDIGGAEGGDAVDAPVDAIPEDMGKVMEKLQYRIEEMEKKMASFEEAMKPSEETKKEEDVKMEEEELPKLDGAPIDESPVAKSQKENKFGKKIVNTQSTFLSKLYK
jgi:hypothetical protein